MSADLAWRSTNLGTRLFAASGRAIAVKLAVVHTAGFSELTAAQLGLFHVIDADGTRLTALAARARLSKASIVELVDRAEAMGLVVRAPDPADARGRIVVPTVSGHRVLAALAAGVIAADRDVVTAIGAGAAARLRDRLGCYIASSPDLVPPGKGAAWAGANAGRALALATTRFTAAVAAAVAAEGFSATPALLAMVRHLDIDGSRLTDLAARARMTKPAMRELVDRGVTLGAVCRHADVRDGRAQVIGFTPRGFDLLAAVRRGVGAAETALAALIGPRDFAATLGDLARLDPVTLAAAA